MDKSDLKFLLFMAVFIAFSLLNTVYHWVFYSAPPVMLMLGIAVYSIWEHKYGNKT